MPYKCFTNKGKYVGETFPHDDLIVPLSSHSIVLIDENPYAIMNTLKTSEETYLIVSEVVSPVGKAVLRSLKQ